MNSCRVAVGDAEGVDEAADGGSGSSVPDQCRGKNTAPTESKFVPSFSPPSDL